MKRGHLAISILKFLCGFILVFLVSSDSDVWQVNVCSQCFYFRVS